MEVVTSTDLKELNLITRGKVRDIYDMGDAMLIVTTDRVSAFDVILPNGIPNKGYVLTKVSEFWFNRTKDIIDNHLITTDVDKMPRECKQYKEILKGRTMFVKKAKAFPVECVARGYITGSGWKDYKATGEICGIKIPEGMQESEKFKETIFTPATKEEVGEHDINISFEEMEKIIGSEDAKALRNYTLRLYETAAEYALTKGIIIADTKFEFGKIDGKIILIDEALTPDSSRFWKADTYKVGISQDSMDKQVIRDYLSTLNWDKKAPGPQLPDDIIQKASEKYLQIMDILIK